MKSELTLMVLDRIFAICKFPQDEPVPDWVLDAPWFSATRTCQELSIVVEDDFVPATAICQKSYRAFEIQGMLDFSLTGILSALLLPLAENKIPVFTISTYNTDYILVRSTDLDKSISILKKIGYDVINNI